MAHSTAPPHHLQRRGGWARRVAGGAVALTLLAGAGAAAVSWRGRDGAGCRSQVLRVSADLRIADAVAEATRDLSPWLPSGKCVEVQVTATRSSTTAAEIARPPGQGLSAPLPDVWIPDSSLWLPVARDTGVGADRTTGPTESVATSPVVIAMPAARAQDLGWPKQQPTWRGLLDDADLTLATTDPREDAPGLASVLSLVHGDPMAALVTASTRLTLPPLGDRSAAELAATGKVDAIPAAEQDVILANRGAGADDRVAAAYDPGLRAALDFPLVPVSPDGDAPSARLAAARTVLQDALLDPATQDLFATSGLRRSDGTLSSAYGTSQGVSEASRRAPAATEVEPALVEDVLTGWASVGRRSNLLVLVDRSASMDQPLPGGTATKAELAKGSLSNLVQGIAPDSKMGLWSFVTGLADQDAQVLVPLGPVTDPVGGPGGESRRQALTTAVAGLDPVPGGGTPLYDAVLAAYREATANYTYGRLNAVLVVTDGRNDDPGSSDLAKLLDTLRVEYDGVRPVRVITAAYGADAETGALRRIADVTGGRSYRALTAAQVRAAFASVLAQL